MRNNIKSPELCKRVISTRHSGSKCSTKINQNQQLAVFNQYWSIGSHNGRMAFVKRCIIISKKQVTKSDATKNRRFMCTCTVVIVGVCKSCLLKILDETDAFF